MPPAEGRTLITFSHVPPYVVEVSQTLQGSWVSDHVSRVSHSRFRRLHVKSHVGWGTAPPSATGQGRLKRQEWPKEKGASVCLGCDFSGLCARGPLLLPACSIHTLPFSLTLPASTAGPDYTESKMRPASQRGQRGTAEGTISTDSLFLRHVWGKLFLTLTSVGALENSFQPSEAPVFNLPSLSCTFSQLWWHGGATATSQMLTSPHLFLPRLCSAYPQLIFSPALLLLKSNYLLKNHYQWQ